MGEQARAAGDEREHCYAFPRVVGDPPLRQLRAWVHDRLASEQPGVVYDAQLAATELTANAYEHAEGAITVRLWLVRDRAVVRLEVEDGSPELLPQRRSAPDQGEPRGRGLIMINALSTAWGVVHASRRKTVWVEIALA